MSGLIRICLFNDTLQISKFLEILLLDSGVLETYNVFDRLINVWIRLISPEMIKAFSQVECSVTELLISLRLKLRYKIFHIDICWARWTGSFLDSSLGEDWTFNFIWMLAWRLKFLISCFLFLKAWMVELVLAQQHGPSIYSFLRWAFIWSCMSVGSRWRFNHYKSFYFIC